MEIRYYVDPITGLPHIYGHGVTEAEVERVVRRPGEDGPSSDGSRQALGQTEGVATSAWCTSRTMTATGVS
jgi:hypothetical protein